MPISMANHLVAPRRDSSAPPSYRSASPSQRATSTCALSSLLTHPSQRGSRPLQASARAGAPAPSAARPAAASQRLASRRREGASPPARQVAAPAAEASFTSCAQAIFYDDNPDNFRGITIRGKFPAIRPVHCPVPMTIQQFKQALGLLAASRLDPPGSKPSLFFFFDFDSTLSEQDGLELSHCETVEELFGGAERRKLMATLLRTLLDLRRVYIVTANISIQRIADVLNELLVGAVGLEDYLVAAGSVDGQTRASSAAEDCASGAPAADFSDGLESGGHARCASAVAASQQKPRWFAVDDTVRYVPVGGKVRAIQQIVSSRGFALKTVFK